MSPDTVPLGSVDATRLIVAVLEYQDPQQPWMFHGDAESAADRIVDALTIYEPTVYRALPELDVPPPAQPPDLDQVDRLVGPRPFTSDDAAAIAVLAVVAPIIAAVAAATRWVRRHRNPGAHR